MSWFSWKPHQYLREALKTTDAWWDSIRGRVDEYHEINFGQLTICLYGTPELGAMHYANKHQANIPSTVGSAWIQAAGNHETAKYEIWLPIKKTKAGNYVINEWGGGHELAHIIDESLRLRDNMKFGDPDEAVSKEFYG